MNKKPFKDIEQIMKAASEANQPAFDELAWKKMEVLLDKEKVRRKPIFWLWWLLPLVLVSGVGGYYIMQSRNNNVNEEQLKFVNQSKVKDQKKMTGEEIVSEPVLISDNLKNSKLPDNEEGKFNEPDTDKMQISNFKVKNNKVTPVLVNAPQNPGNDIGKKTKITGNDNGSTRLNIQPGQPESDEKENTDLVEKNNPKYNTNNLGDSLKPVNNNEIAGNDIKSEKLKDHPDTATRNSPKQNKQQNKVSKFYFIAAAGVEANGVKLFSNSEFAARYGVAAGYQFNKSISVQTGFFVSNKKYVAGPGDYTAKEGSYWSMVDITKVDANCLVYEIPLLIRYDFTPGKKLDIFSSVGLSSYIMKTEDYQYYYNRYGYSHVANASYKGNQNLFSVLRISAGVEKKLSDQFSLNLAPGLAIPLAGVGEGQVKLYSADVMIGLKFTPLRKK